MAVKFKDTININDQYEFPLQDGSVGQVLTTDGSGGLSFADIVAVGAEANFVHYNGKNSTGSTIPVGTGVMAVGTDGNSGHILIAPMVADGTVEGKFFLGITDSAIANGEIGKVVHFGVIDQVNTTAFTNGDVLWCDPATAGGFTVTEPGAPNVKIAPAFVLNSATNGKLAVRVQGNEGLYDLKDINISSLGDGQVLTYDSTLEYWKNDNVVNSAIAGTGVSVSSATGDVTITNTAPDQTVVLTGTGAATVTGTYPTFNVDVEESAGGVDLTVETNTFNCNGTQTVFTVDSAITSESRTQVYLDGVYQSKDNYSSSGSSITMSEAPESGTVLEVVHFLSLNGVIKIDYFTGTGSQTLFELVNWISSENNTQVYFDGVYQSKSNYSVSGNEITFSTAPDSGVDVEVVSILPSTGGGAASNSWSTATRPSTPYVGLSGYNTDTLKIELWNGIGWFNVGPAYPFTADSTILTADSTAKVSETTF